MNLATARANLLGEASEYPFFESGSLNERFLFPNLGLTRSPDRFARRDWACVIKRSVSYIGMMRQRHDVAA